MATKRNPPKIRPPHWKKPCIFNQDPLPHLDLRLTDEGTTKPPKPHRTETSLIVWLRWYLHKLVRGGTSSWHTEAAKLNDLQKFINFYYDKHPSGDITLWNNELSKSFTSGLKKAEYGQSTIARTVASISHFGASLKGWKCEAFEPDVIKAFATKAAKETKPATLQLIKGNKLLAEGEPVFKLMAMIAEKIALQNTSKKKRPYRDVAILYFLYYTGVRAEELCNIDIQQMTLFNKTGDAAFSDVVGKGGYERTVFLRDIPLDKLFRYFDKERRGHRRGPLFQSSRQGHRMQRQIIWEIVDQIRTATQQYLMEDANAPANWVGAEIKAHPHTFRHERSYALVQSPDMSESEAAEELGHRSTRQIMRYIKRSEQARFDKLRKIG